MSTSLQNPDTELSTSRGASVAVIGPDERRRRIVAKALANSDTSSVREFLTYPARLSDLPRMMEQGYSVVLIDVDSDQDYALEIVEKISAIGTANVIVYSARNDPILMMKCMRAGARDFLPMPQDPGMDAMQPDPSKGQEKAPGATGNPGFPPSQELAEPPKAFEEQQLPERRMYKGATYVKGRDDRWHLQLTNIAQPYALPSDFNEWDGEPAETSQPTAPKDVEADPNPEIAPEAIAKDESTKSTLYVAPGHSGRIAGGIETDADVIALFRNTEVVDDRQPIANRNWKKWVLFAAVPVIVGCLFLLFWIFPVRQESPAPAPPQTVVPQQVKPIPPADEPKQIAKPSPATPADATEASAQPNQVPTEMMDAQLAAPAKISKGIKTQASADEPPTGFAPGAIEAGAGVPGSPFGQAKVKVVPSVSAISAGVAEGMLIHRTDPVYPQFARESHVAGTVVLGATIAKSGQIQDLHLINGPAVLASAALEAVRTWRYKPYLLNNEPVEVQTTIKVVFALGKQ